MTDKEKELLQYLKDVWKRVRCGLFLMLAAIFALFTLCIIVIWIKANI